MLLLIVTVLPFTATSVITLFSWPFPRTLLIPEIPNYVGIEIRRVEDGGSGKNVLISKLRFVDALIEGLSAVMVTCEALPIKGAKT